MTFAGVEMFFTVTRIFWKEKKILTSAKSFSQEITRHEDRFDTKIPLTLKTRDRATFYPYEISTRFDDGVTVFCLVDEHLLKQYFLDIWRELESREAV